MTEAKKHTDGISRRTFLKAAAVAPLAGCEPNSDPKKDATATPKKWTPNRNAPNIYDVLNRFVLRGQSGAEIDATDLKDKYAKKYATLSVSFKGCNNESCPLTNQNLSNLDPNANVVHFVVNLNPEWDGGFNEKTEVDAQKARDGFVKQLRDWGVKGEIVVLFPSSTEDAKKIQDYVGTYTIPGKDAQLHGSEIVLFAPGGNLPTDKKEDRHKWRKDGISGDLSEWNNLIKNGKGFAR